MNSWRLGGARGIPLPRRPEAAAEETSPHCRTSTADSPSTAGNSTPPELRHWLTGPLRGRQGGLRSSWGRPGLAFAEAKSRGEERAVEWHTGAVAGERCGRWGGAGGSPVGSQGPRDPFKDVARGATDVCVLVCQEPFQRSANRLAPTRPGSGPGGGVLGEGHQEVGDGLVAQPGQRRVTSGTGSRRPSINRVWASTSLARVAPRDLLAEGVPSTAHPRQPPLIPPRRRACSCRWGRRRRRAGRGCRTRAAPPGAAGGSRIRAPDRRAWGSARSPRPRRGCSRWCRPPRPPADRGRKEPDCARTATGPARISNRWRRGALPSRRRARDNEEAHGRATAIPCSPVPSLSHTARQDERSKKARASTKYITTRAGSNRTRRSREPVSSRTASTSCGSMTCVNSPRWPGAYTSRADATGGGVAECRGHGTSGATISGLDATGIYQGSRPLVHELDKTPDGLAQRCCTRRDAIEDRLAQWRRDGSPALEQFQITVTPDGHHTCTWPRRG